MSLLIDIALVLVAGLGSAGYFAASSSLAGDIPDTAIVAMAAIGVAFAGLALGGVPTRKLRDALGTRGIIEIGIGGSLCFALAPVVVLLLRRTDAPSGSETLFFTTAAWAVIAVALALAVRRTATLTQLAGALVALLGAAAVVANWERPSSFSPFVKFPTLELGMLVAGLGFAAGSLVLSRAARRYGARPVMSVAGVAAALVALVVCAAFGDLGGLLLPAFSLPRVLLAVVSWAAFSGAWVLSLGAIGMARASSALFIPPIALTFAGALEVVGRAYGVNPIQWPGVLAGTVLIVVGGVVVFTLHHAVDADREGRPDLVALAVAGVGVVAGFVALALPAFAASIEGTASGKSFSAQWQMRGFESASGWLPLLLALLALAAALDVAWRGWGSRNRTIAAAAVLIAAGTWPLLLATPLRTWALWIPGEVLQDLGTEYATMTMSPVAQPAGLVGLVLAVVSAVALALGAVAWRRSVRRRVEGSA